MTQPIMEEGRWAVLRNGEAVGPLQAICEKNYPWWCNGICYTRNGLWSIGVSSSLDIIETFQTRPEAETWVTRKSEPVAAIPAPAVDWEQRRWEAALAATDGDIEAHRPLRRDGQGFGHYQYTREEARLRFADALIAAMKVETK